MLSCWLEERNYQQIQLTIESNYRLIELIYRLKVLNEPLTLKFYVIVKRPACDKSRHICILKRIYRQKQHIYRLYLFPIYQVCPSAQVEKISFLSGQISFFKLIFTNICLLCAAGGFSMTQTCGWDKPIIKTSA